MVSGVGAAKACAAPRTEAMSDPAACAVHGGGMEATGGESLTTFCREQLAGHRLLTQHNTTISECMVVGIWMDRCRKDRQPT